MHHIKEYLADQLDYYAKHMALIYNRLSNHRNFLDSLEEFMSLKPYLPPQWKINLRKSPLLWAGRIKQRIYGWRWCSLYYPKKLKEHQFNLIGDLGYEVVNF
ncbi:MAG: hypothetical protein CMI18_08330 [Opitutaceae bacterium]|nr:hypothetical protein [Opitutaceae bacterium]